MLTFAYKRFDGVVPEPGDPSRSSAKDLDNEDQALLEKVEAGFETVGELYNACKFRAAPSVPSGLPRGNRGGQAWRGRSCEATAQLTRSVSPGPQGALVPDQGGSASGGDERVRHPARGGQPEDDPSADPAAHGPTAPRVPGLCEGQTLRQPAPLFKMLDESVIEDEYARLEG